MKRYTITEALRELKTYRQRFHKLCERCNIIPQSLPNNEKEKRITAEELAVLRNALYEEQMEAQSAADVSDLTAQMQSLQREVERLRTQLAAITADTIRQTRQDEQQVSRVDTVPLSLTTEHRSPQRGRGGFPQDPIPDGYVYLQAFAVAHGVPKATAWGHVAAGHLSETTAPIAGRRERHHYLTPEQQQKAVTYWRRIRGDDFRECGDVACSCHES